jgi:hypothetical protein
MGIPIKMIMEKCELDSVSSPECYHELGTEGGVPRGSAIREEALRAYGADR